MFKTEKKLILASQSPRRKSFLEDLGLSFEIVFARLSEQREAGESPEIFVKRMAFEKATGICRSAPEAWILSADTIVYIDDELYSKPGSDEEAHEMLMSLSGRDHSVMTSYCLACHEQAVAVVEEVCTRVRFTSFSDDIAAAYVRTGEGSDKAGSYGIQGLGGSLVERIDGSYSNVVGLPLAETIALLQKFGVIAVS